MLGQWLCTPPGSKDHCKCYHIPSQAQDTFFDSSFCEISTQVMVLDKLTKLSQAKSLHTYVPRMKLFSKCISTSRKEAKKVIVAGVSYVA